MPITLQFGPWAPDLDNTPIQVPENQGPMPIPCADCLNVFYANGNYQSIQSPQVGVIDGATIQALSEQALNAFSYYDNVQGQETVFVGTADGVQQLNSDGSWSMINVTTTQSANLVGQAFAFSTGILPTANRLHAAPAAFATGTLTPSVTGNVFIAAYNSTHVATGFSTGKYGAPISPAFGTLGHQSEAFGTLQALYDFNGFGILYVAAPVPTSNPGQNAFVTIKANGKTFNSAQATYTYIGFGLGEWLFPTPFGFAAGTTYQVIFT